MSERSSSRGASPSSRSSLLEPQSTTSTPYFDAPRSPRPGTTGLENVATFQSTHQNNLSSTLAAQHQPGLLSPLPSSNNNRATQGGTIISVPNATPRIGSTPRMYTRKSSTIKDLPPPGSSGKGLWNSLKSALSPGGGAGGGGGGGGGRGHSYTPSQHGLPISTSRLGTRTPGGMTPGLGGITVPNTPALAIKAIVTRPFFLLGRRGPLPTIFLLVGAAFCYILLTSEGGVSVSRDSGVGVNGGFGAGAKAAERWREKQAQLKALGRGGGVKDEAKAVKKAKKGGEIVGEGGVKGVKQWAIVKGDGMGGELVEEPKEEEEDDDEDDERRKDEDDDEDEDEVIPARPVLQKVLGGGGKNLPKAILPPSRKDGRVPIKEGKLHPIPALMERAKKRWEELKGKQSKTFGEAVREYEARYGRKPPKGFDQWYAFARMNDVLLIDEFDLITSDLHPYRAFRPSSFRARVQQLAETFDKTWVVRITKGAVFREGELADHDRAVGVEQLMKKFLKKLPDLTMVYNGHDGARVGLVAEERARLEDLVSKGEYDDDEAPYPQKERGPEPWWGMIVFCGPESAVRTDLEEYGWPAAESTGLEMPPLEAGAAGTLIDDFKAYMNVCESPQYRHFHATTSWVYSHHPPALMPLLTPGVQTRFGDVYTIITEQFGLEVDHDITWSEKPFTSLVWRGQTSGPLWEATTPWKTTHRARLHLLSHAEDGTRKFVVTNDKDITKVTKEESFVLNPMFLDTGMVGPAVQCIEDDGTCDAMFEAFHGYEKRMTFDRQSLYKYVLDVDGNSWSGRFRRLMLSNAAVVKATIFREFWTDWAIPWLHFIPMQVDYSDMWDIMAFFRGGVHGEGAHDDLGKEIADAGREWATSCYRWVDLEAYQYRLMLEYARIYNEETEPGSNDFQGDTSQEPVWTED